MIEWSEYYSNRKNSNLFPESCCVRMLLSNDPNGFSQNLKLTSNSNLLDLGCGNGRHFTLLRELPGKNFACEIDEEIVANLRKVSANFDVNISEQKLPKTTFEKEQFNCILSFNSCYYLSNNGSQDDNFKEISRILVSGGFFAGTLLSSTHSIFDSAKILNPNLALIKKDKDNIRQNSRMSFVENYTDIKEFLSPYFENIKFAFLRDEFNDFRRHLYYFTCTKQ